jgi:hypothetical protein
MVGLYDLILFSSSVLFLISVLILSRVVLRNSKKAVFSSSVKLFLIFSLILFNLSSSALSLPAKEGDLSAS